MLKKRLLKIAAADPYQFPNEWVVPKSNKRKKELDMWRTWKESGEKEEHLEPLLTTTSPILRKQVNTWKPAATYTPALELRAKVLLVEGMRRYDPTKAQLNTHLHNHLHFSLGRWTRQRQNFSRITENRVKIIGDYRRSKQSLEMILGRVPSAQEIADDLHISVDEIRKLENELRDDKQSSMFTEEMNDPFADEASVHKDVLRFLYYSLTPEEQLVWEYMIGINGKPKTKKGGDIAKALGKGWSDAKVSTTKAKIIKKYNDSVRRMG